MNNLMEIRVPDIGDFKDVPVIELLVKPGDTVEKETPLITLETEKAAMEVPAPQAGVVKEIKVKIGDKISEGTLILVLEAAAPSDKTGAESAGFAKAAESTEPAEPIEMPASPSAPVSEKDNKTRRDSPDAVNAAPAQGRATPSVPRGDIHADVVVLGAGPGGYTAAFRAADLGKKVVLIERYPTLGGVCLNVGCIPSKALLHVAKVITEAEEVERQGIAFGKPAIELSKLRMWKESTVGKLTKGLTGLAKQRKVQVVQGNGKFTSPNMIQVETPDSIKKTVSFEHCIIAAGSSAARIPGFPYDDPRLMDSTGALKLEDIPKRMLIIGGGIIGLEMATVYDALGCKISVVELMDQLIPGADADLIKPLHRRIQKRYEAIHLKTRVTGIEAQESGLRVTFESTSNTVPAPESQIYDRILMAVGRRPNGRDIGAENAAVNVDERGFIPVSKQLRTSVPHIFAIGDICGEPMLAHKASHEGKLAAEIIAGGEHTKNATFDARAIPSVAYTDPEIAWMGLTEIDAGKEGIEYEKAVFPWAASGRALAMARDEGVTKLLLDKKTRRILGAGIVGVNAGELIAETVLGLEMGADMEDIGLTIHPHPTLSETIFFAAEMAEGSITDLYMPKK